MNFKKLFKINANDITRIEKINITSYEIEIDNHVLKYSASLNSDLSIRFSLAINNTSFFSIYLDEKQIEFLRKQFEKFAELAFIDKNSKNENMIEWGIEYFK